MIYGMQTTSSSSSFSKPFVLPLKSDLKAFHDATIVESDIDHCKELANREKYFKLFSKHLKKFENEGLGKRIALIDISNLGVDKKIIDLNPRAEYVLVDNFLDYEMLKAVCPNADISLICTDENGVLDQLEKLQKLNINMKFDVVVGNPPYDRNLHLKILAEVMKHLSDEGEIVWLCPIKLYKKSNLFKTKCPVENTHVAEIVQHGLASSLFNIGLVDDLGIVVANNNQEHAVFFNNKEFLDKLIEKLSKLTSIYLRKSKIHKDLSLNIAENTCRFNLEKDGRITDGCYQIVATRREDAFADKELGAYTVAIECKTEQEREFAYCFYKSKFMRYLYKEIMLGRVIGKFIPDYRNLTLDFSKPWTDERFYKYFNLTPNEIKLIEDTIKE